MNSKKIDFSVGLFVLVGLAAIVYMAVQIGGGRFLGNDSQKVTAVFTNIGGLSSGSNITIAGVKIGTVGPITLNPETLKAEVALLIDEDIELWDDATAAIKTNGLIGDKYISVYPGTNIEGISSPLSGPIVDTEPAIDIESLISKFASGSVIE
ncbi:outer membrane lipid asymmetry maintenance protein MlaD [Pelagicoccus enzymogenes]|uniref:outer membrane lipid asymmetry maintenance protein MlaD n=1 Tax=Pelagicoccus enzymogenes TaxID=2773457 RepID=UPI00280E82D5|nr:outer membrane lipid asymmetry maintenance protein MlaD [Pelagicoccus enzymogenes]MDQ8199275.1 outer membrane lipid asymmetry maintenance protein MlaD [Pelagicoccus enzymogenes]